MNRWRLLKLPRIPPIKHQLRRPRAAPFFVGYNSGMSELQKLGRQFLEHLEAERGRSLKTVENYRRYLDRFFLFAKVEKPKYLTDEIVREYRRWLNRHPHQAGQTGAPGATLKKKTQNYYLIALRAFLKYLRKRGIESL